MHGRAGEGDAAEVEDGEVGAHAWRDAADVVLAAEHARAAARREREDVARGHLCGTDVATERLDRPADAREQHRLARLGEQMRTVVAGAAVDADADRHAGVEHPAHRRDPRREPHVAARAVRHAGAGAREEIDAVHVELDAVRVPNVAADPAELGRVLGGRGVEVLPAVGDVVVVLGEVRVQAHAMCARERRRLAHQIAADAERRARRDRDIDHRAECAVVERADDALGVAQDRVLALDQRIRRQSALRLADAHAAAAGDEAHPDLVRRLDAVVEQHAVRVDVEMVAARRAAREQQLGHRHLRRHAHHLRRQPGPDRIEAAQPREQLRVLHRGDRTRQRLEHVVVRVDEPRHDDVAARVDHLVGVLRQIGGGADGLDQAAAHEDRRAAQLEAGIVEGRDAVGIAQEQRLGGSVHHARA